MKDALIVVVVLTVSAILTWPIKALAIYVRRVNSEAQRLELSLGSVQGEPEPVGLDGYYPQPAAWMGAVIVNQGTYPLRMVKGTVLSLAGDLKHELGCDLLPPTNLISAKWPKVPGDDLDRYEYKPYRAFNALLRVEFIDKNRSHWVVDTEGTYSRTVTPPWIWIFLFTVDVRAKSRGRKVSV